MARKTIFVIGIVVIVLMAMALSGCTSTSPSGPGASTGPTKSTSSSGTKTGSNAQATTTVSGETITIAGTKTDQSNDQLSGEFELKEGTYLLEWNDVGGPLGFFTTSYDSTDGKGGTGIVSLTDEKGSSAAVVGGDNNLMTPPGKYKVKVGNGGTYTITFSKPSTGASPPVTITGARGEQKAKAVALKAGKFTIGVKHTGWSSDKIGTTMIGVWDVKTGKDVIDLGTGWVQKENGEVTGEAPADGVYIFSTSWSAYSGGDATLTQ
ncbi:MAG TPA: hypothetical protein VMC61_07480 [Methanocella sp.]|nr:hypothetical protein [Methanocella sp.]